ncbi:MAG TPA: hypothetical protein VFA44_02900 [Gaiellaceae bacterium]|nr:hypothetical protein [Gaiellaceae bacterium]
MGAGSRRKGVRGEAEVAAALRAAKLTVRSLEAAGDHLALAAGGLVLHVEVKRAERARPVEWSRQAEAEAPPGTVPIVVWRPSREPWRATLLLDDLLALVRAADEPWKPIVLRRAAVCARCGRLLPAGSGAVWHARTGAVVHVDCEPEASAA